MRFVGSVVLLSLALTGSALADNGVRPIWDDFQPAVSTQYRRPEGGRRYPPPNTATLLQKQEVTPYDGPITYQGGPNARTPPDRSSNQPPSRVGR